MSTIELTDIEVSFIANTNMETKNKIIKKYGFRFRPLLLAKMTIPPSLVPLIK